MDIMGSTHSKNPSRLAVQRNFFVCTFSKGYYMFIKHTRYPRTRRILPDNRRQAEMQGHKSSGLIILYWWWN
jgi:hypothetical protein